MLLALWIAGLAPPPHRTAFACDVGKATVVVVQDAGALAYRLVRGRRVEVEVTNGYVARTGFSGGGELQAVFRSDGWTYVVFQRTIRTGFSEANEPRFEAGVDVMRGERVVSHRRCRDGGSQFHGEILSGLREGAFIEH